MATQAKEEAKQPLISKENRPIIIAGPCSVETEDQVIETCKAIAATGKATLLRGGIWKPRTRPNTFEGIGVKGLPWLKEVKLQTGMPVSVEVAKAKHVEACLKYDIDVLWIGARTTVNPFAVQEIADALKGIDIPVMVKNPVNPDLALWLGATERIEKAGIKEIAAIHRGFSNASEQVFRNRPEWQIAIDFMSERPELPLICDPSHICGKRELLFSVSQKALDLNYDGLMIETHRDPRNAWSDAAQQVTPEEFEKMISELVFRTHHEDDQLAQKSLDFLRHEINQIDDDLFHLLAERMKVARQIGEYKKKNEMTILQPKRWAEILEKAHLKGKKNQLSDSFVTRFLKAVHDESIDQQEKIMRKKGDV